MIRYCPRCRGELGHPALHVRLGALHYECECGFVWHVANL